MTKQINNNPPPQDFESLRVYIINCQKSLPRRLLQTAQYAVQNPNDIAFGTAASIASAAGVQPSTLVRLAHQLGYESFLDFQTVFRERLRGLPASYEARISALKGVGDDDSEESKYLNGFLLTAKRSIDNLESTFNPKVFKSAIATLAKAETIYIVAKRRAYPIAVHMAYIFGRLKIRYQIVGSSMGNDTDMISMATSKDAAIGICFSPYATETIAEVQVLVENKVPIIGFTDSVFSHLATQSTHWLEVVEDDHAGFRSLAASITLSAVLPIAIAKERQLCDKEEN